MSSSPSAERARAPGLGERACGERAVRCVRCERVQEPEPHRQHWGVGLDGGEAVRCPGRWRASSKVAYYYSMARLCVMEV